MSNLELQAELLRTEYPNLSPDHDPDIERYYNLRSLGRSADAIVLYQRRLVPRYPDEQFRTQILRAYRTHSPQYAELFRRAYHELGQRVLERTKKLIKYIAVKAESFDETDVYSTLKAADAILALLPRERFEAVMAMERLHRYAQGLQYCEKSMAKAEALIRAYVTETLSVVEEERERRRQIQEQARTEERRRLVAQDKAELQNQRRMADKYARQRALQEGKRRSGLQKRPGEPARKPQVHINLKAIHFSAADLARIQIPPGLTRLEDRTLAFCFKYWNLVRDAAFERILFLYSRKYKTKHYEVFSAIQRGRLSGKRDEEILAAVMSILITGYYYSIQGDRYLQQQWALLKAKLEGHEKVVTETPRKVASLRRRTRPVVGRQGVSPPIPGGETLADRRVHTASSPAPIQAPDAAKGGAPVPPVPVRRFSVSERLVHLSGRSYDVYQDLFLAHVRSAIRRVLGKGRGIFFSLPQEAEDLVYGYLKRNYSNPYMNWEQSQERKELEQLGFQLPAIEAIIDECYRIMGT